MGKCVFKEEFHGAPWVPNSREHLGHKVLTNYVHNILWTTLEKKAFYVKKP